MRLVCLAFIYSLLFCSQVFAGSIKEPNVAGAFYSDDPQELSRQIDTFLAQAAVNPFDKKIQAMIVPHAGYMYSGPVAAYGYKAVSKNKYTTIVLMGPSHFYPFDGISVWMEGGFKTPLGVVPVDSDFTKKLVEAGKGVIPFGTTAVFEKEHSLEVELPFIQKIFGNVKIVPILMGNPDPKVCQALAALLSKLIGPREDVLIIASSDMSHYFPYDTANQMDEASLKAIKEENPEKLWNGCFINHDMEMCGVVPVTTLLLYAKERGLKPQILKHANSGDTTGDKSKVVGYSSVVFYSDSNSRGVMQSTSSLTEAEKNELLNYAHQTLINFVTTGQAPELKTSDSRLLQKEGAFVTLREKGDLRGCIGHIISDQPLWQTVHDMTIEAASKDPRFPAVSKGELNNIDLEISVLTVPQRVPNAEAVTLGRDGVIVSDNGFHQGVFLPQVAAETKWSKDEFLSELCSQKAGLPSDCWKDPKNSLWTFQAEVFGQ